MSKCRFGAGVLFATVCAALQAQDNAVSLPMNPVQWINSPPISMSAMKGKGAVLYFFEET